MEALDVIIARRRRNKKLAIIIGLILVVVLIAIIIPVAVVVDRRSKKGPVVYANSTVILPLYVYPKDSSWNPLYSAIENQPGLNFVVVVNPDSGPGSNPLPNSDFAPNIKKLNGYSNVQTVGYVRTGFSTRDVNDVLTDIKSYEYWATQDQSLTMNGIFFDEVTTVNNTDNHNYLQTINSKVKSSSNFKQENFIVHNPGSVQQDGLENNMTDVTIIFEGPFDAFENAFRLIASLPNPRTTYGAVVHSLPSNITSDDLKTYISQASSHARYLYFTYLDASFYASFGSRFNDFISAVANV